MPTTTANAPSGSNVIFVVSNAYISPLMLATGTGIPASTYVQNVNNTAITLTNPTSSALNNAQVTFSPPFALPISYYTGLVTSAYQGTAPNMISWLTSNLTLGNDITNCLASFIPNFNLSTAVGAQLDVLGNIIGVSRQLPFNPTGSIQYAVVNGGGTGYAIGDTVQVDQGYGFGGVLEVLAETGGVASGFLGISAYGNNYGPGTALPTTTLTGSGSGMTVNLFVNNYITTTVLLGTGTGIVVTSTNNIYVGQSVTGVGIPVGATVTAVDYVFNSITISEEIVGVLNGGDILTIYNNPLGDPYYRTLLQCTIFKNHWNGQIDSFLQFWNSIFGSNTITIQDCNVPPVLTIPVMTATITISSALSSIVIDLLENGYLVPRPEGVLYNFVIASLPVFGFDRTDAYISGFGIGKFIG